MQVVGEYPCHSECSLRNMLVNYKIGSEKVRTFVSRKRPQTEFNLRKKGCQPLSLN